IEFLNRKIHELDEKVRRVVESDKYAKLLMTVPGISYYSALLISSEIADIDRFPDHEHLCSYAKLSPGVRQSGETQHTSKSVGNSMMNWIMIQCTRVHVRRYDSVTPTWERPDLLSSSRSLSSPVNGVCSPARKVINSGGWKVHELARKSSRKPGKATKRGGRATPSSKLSPIPAGFRSVTPY